MSTNRRKKRQNDSSSSQHNTTHNKSRPEKKYPNKPKDFKSTSNPIYVDTDEEEDFANFKRLNKTRRRSSGRNIGLPPPPPSLSKKPMKKPNLSNTVSNPLPIKSQIKNEHQTLQDLHDMIQMYQQAVHDVHQAIVDVKETSEDITYKVKSVTEQLHMIIDRREEELLEQISTKTASKIFALDSQFTKLKQRLMFIREARNEAESLINKNDEYNQNNGNSNDEQKPSLVNDVSITRIRDHSGGSVINYNARKNRIMKIVKKTKLDSKKEFEKELNRGTPVVATRFKVVGMDITEQLETLGNIIDDEPLRQFIISPPAIIKTKAFKRSVRIQIKSREKVNNLYEHQVLSCQFEPQLVFISVNDLQNGGMHHSDDSNSNGTGRKRKRSMSALPENLNHPETLKWTSLGWVELNPDSHCLSTQMVAKPKNGSTVNDNLDHIITEYTKLITGLKDILQNANGQQTYIRVRMRKLVKFEEDIHAINNGLNKKKEKEKEQNEEDDNDYAPIWIESHFSRAHHLILHKSTPILKGSSHDEEPPIPQQNIPPLASLADISANIGIDDDDPKSPEYEKVRRKKSKKHHHKKEKIRDLPSYATDPVVVESSSSSPFKYSNIIGSKNSTLAAFGGTPKQSLNFVSEDAEEKFNDEDAFPNTSSSYVETAQSPADSWQRTNSLLYDADDSEFTKQRRHSNYHIQDELYQPGITYLDKTRIVWHDIVNNKDIVVSDKIPVSARSSCGMVVAHDVLVADEESADEDASRYTSILFRIGGTLNKKTDKSVDMLDLGTGMWSSLPSLKHARSLCQPVLMNGNIVMPGGCGKKTKPLSSVELFDFEQQRWSPLKPMNTGRWGHAVYVMYYEENEAVARTPSIMSNSVNSSNESSKMIVAGGWSKKKKNLQSAEIYDVNTNEWTPIASMNVARSRCVACEWTSIDRFGVIGGWGNSCKIVEFYDSTKDQWFRLKDLNHEHIYPSCGLLSDQHLYAMNRILDDDAKKIIKHHKISTLRGRPAPFVLGSNDQLSCLELFDDRSDQWIILQTFPLNSSNTIVSMIECALPTNITSSLNKRSRAMSKQQQKTPPNSWGRRTSKIVGIL